MISCDDGNCTIVSIGMSNITVDNDGYFVATLKLMLEPNRFYLLHGNATYDTGDRFKTNQVNISELYMYVSQEHISNSDYRQ